MEPGTDSLPHAKEPAPHRRGPSARAVGLILAESLLVALTGFGLALLANGLSPRGLSLRRDYFPATNGESGRTGMIVLEPSAGGPTQPAAVAATNPVAARLEALGLRLVGTDEVTRWYHDPRRAQELIVFVDARDDSRYQEGHVPGAYPFDRYYPENQLPGVLPPCQMAEVIVVYCGGGDCEDSEFAAVALRDAGVPAERLGVYAGGMTDWVAQGLPVEIGPRGSGNIQGQRHD